MILHVGLLTTMILLDKEIESAFSKIVALLTKTHNKIADLMEELDHGFKI